MTYEVEGADLNNNFHNISSFMTGSFEKLLTTMTVLQPIYIVEV